MNKSMILFFSLFCFLACQHKPQAQMVAGENTYGDVISAENASALAEIDELINGQNEVRVKLKGKIHEVCQAKGCWMTLQDENANHEVFIKFKDYAFFVPKDADGREAIVEGVLTIAETSVDELRHYAEDKGQSKEEIAAITKPKKELKMMANGVIIYN